MDKDFEIEIENEETSDSEGVQLPVNFLSFGEIEHDDVKVYIKQDVYKALEKYARVDTEHERGTIILGDYSNALGKTHVVISDYIEARHTDASASTLTFTHETWEYVYKEQAEKYPDKKIVGWQHTHPNYGIFLSNYDLFIHENFFNLPFQVAYVIDPIQNIRGFFQWKNGKIEKLKGFYIYDEPGKTIKIENEKKKENKEEKKSTSKMPGFLLPCFIVVALILGILTGVLYKKISVFENKQEAMQKIIIAQENKINGFKENEPVTEAKDDYVKLQEYTVKENDTLISICKEFDIDYMEYSGLILGINGKNADDYIYTGEKLFIPVPAE